MSDVLLFRFVPTMRCNLRCSYCFLKHSKGDEPTMFDKISPEEWVKAMKNYSAYDVEFYMWGGEPFCIDGTYDLVKGLAEYDFVSWARMDTNLTFTKKIVNRCPTPKLKLLCSWHTETFNFEDMWSNVMALHEQKMVGMVNFVASDVNMAYLKENNLVLNDLIKRFEDNGLFLNVAADFGKGDGDEYRSFITQYMTEADWDHIQNHFPPKGVECSASQKFFTVSDDGNITSCGAQKKAFLRRSKTPISLGNFFKGDIARDSYKCLNERCLSIISYPHRLDNDFSSNRHLEVYVARNSQWRKDRDSIK